MAKQLFPDGVTVLNAEGTPLVIMSHEKRGKHFWVHVEDEEGNKSEVQEEGLTIYESTPAEVAAIEEGNPKLATGSMAGFPKFRTIHPVQKIVAPNGKTKRIQNNEDTVAIELLAWTLDEKDPYLFPDIAKAGLSEELRAKYSHLNAGMQRMNLGNKVRGLRNPKNTVIKTVV